MARVRVEPESCDQGRRKNDAFTPSAAKLQEPIFDLSDYNGNNRLLLRNKASTTTDRRLILLLALSCFAVNLRRSVYLPQSL